MKRFLFLVLMAVLGGAAGSAIRQVVDAKQSPESKSGLTIAASPTPIVAGSVAGLLSPRWKAATAFVVAANIGANLRDDPLGAMLGAKLSGANG